jgi:hypothetical protein
MEPITIPIKKSGWGRVVFDAMVSTGDMKSLDLATFKLDSGSDFTTLSETTLKNLGYTDEYLRSRPAHAGEASTATEDDKLKNLQYIEHVSIKFEDRELQGCRIYFALGTKLRNLFGCDMMRYFNREIDYDKCEMRLTERVTDPQLLDDEKPIQIYNLAEGE